MKKTITAANLSFVTLCVCVFGYVSLRSSLLGLSIDFYELIDTRFISSGILFLCLVSLVAFPTWDYLSSNNLTRTVSEIEPRERRGSDLFLYMFYRIIKLLIGLCIGVYVFEILIIERSLLKSIVEVSDKYHLTIALAVIFCIFVISIPINNYRSKIKQVIDSILFILVISMFKIFLISFVGIIAVALYSFSVVFYGMLNTYKLKLDKQANIVPIIVTFLSLTTGAIMFGLNILPVVRTEITPFSYRSAEIIFKPNSFLVNSEYFNIDTISACIIFDTKDNIYFILRDSQDKNILSVSKDVIVAASYDNSKVAVDYCLKYARVSGQQRICG